MDSLLQEIKHIIQSARKAAVQSVDLLQVVTNFEIGRRIVEFEQGGTDRAEYGKTLIQNLSQSLIREFGRGFSKRNLEYMRRFYLLYKDRSLMITQQEVTPTSLGSEVPNYPLHFTGIVQTLSAQFTLGWSHYIFLTGIKDADERNFYEIEATNQGWSIRELKRQFNSSRLRISTLSTRQRRTQAKIARMDRKCGYLNICRVRPSGGVHDGFGHTPAILDTSRRSGFVPARPQIAENI